MLLNGINTNLGELKMSEALKDRMSFFKGVTRPTQLIFQNSKGNEVGRLTVEDDGIKFEGVMDESTDVFVEYLENNFNTKLKTYREALEKITRVNAMDYEYQRWAKEVLENN
jgi:hypothetical protein